MRPADRLFQIVLMLGRGRVVTAKTLAEHLEVSERTIYRDIQDLAASGVPIEGEAGVGYVLRRGYQIPPLMFNEEELAGSGIRRRRGAKLGGRRDGKGRRQHSREGGRGAAGEGCGRRSIRTGWWCRTRT